MQATLCPPRSKEHPVGNQLVLTIAGGFEVFARRSSGVQTRVNSVVHMNFGRTLSCNLI